MNGSTRRITIAMALVAVVAMMLAGPGWAQAEAPSQLGDGIDQIGDPIGGVTDPIDGAVGDVGDSVDGAVGDVVGGAEGAAGGAVEDAGDAAGTAGGAVGGAVEGAVGGAVDNATGGQDTVDEATEAAGPVEDLIEETTGKAGQTAEAIVRTVEETASSVGGSLGGNVPGVAPKSSKSPKKKAGRTPHSAPGATARGPAADVLRLLVAIEPAPRSLRSTPPVALITQPAPGVVDTIIRTAAEAAKALAFPILLAALVLAFLVIHNRLDRGDAKLALAPVDIETESLSFQ